MKKMCQIHRLLVKIMLLDFVQNDTEMCAKLVGIFLQKIAIKPELRKDKCVVVILRFFYFSTTTFLT